MNRNSTSSEKQPQRPPPPPSTRGKKPQRGGQADAQKPGVEGEGSYTAARRYNEGLREHIEQQDVDAEAEEALEALEGDEREELQAAEEQGKRGAAQGVRPVQQTESGLGGPQPRHGK
jgi:hypothetical protein